MSAQMSLDTLRHSPSRSTVEQKNEVEDGPATQGGVNQMTSERNKKIVLKRFKKLRF